MLVEEVKAKMTKLLTVLQKTICITALNSGSIISTCV